MYVRINSTLPCIVVCAVSVCMHVQITVLVIFGDTTVSATGHIHLHVLHGH